MKYIIEIHIEALAVWEAHKQISLNYKQNTWVTFQQHSDFKKKHKKKLYLMAVPEESIVSFTPHLLPQHCTQNTIENHRRTLSRPERYCGCADRECKGLHNGDRFGERSMLIGYDVIGDKGPSRYEFTVAHYVQ